MKFCFPTYINLHTRSSFHSQHAFNPSQLQHVITTHHSDCWDLMLYSFHFFNRRRASLQESIEYIDNKSHGLVKVVLDYQRLQHPNVPAKIALVGISTSTALRPAAHRSLFQHEWDFRCVGAWDDVVSLLTSLFKVLGQDPAFISFEFSNLTFNFVFEYHNKETMWLHFVMQSYFLQGKSNVVPRHRQPFLHAIVFIERCLLT